MNKAQEYLDIMIAALELQLKKAKLEGNSAMAEAVEIAIYALGVEYVIRYPQ